MHVNWTAIAAITGLVNTVAVIGLGGFTYWSGKSKATQKEIADLARVIGGHAERLGVLENERRHAPTHHDLGKVYNELNATAREMAELRGALTQIKPQMQLVSEYLLREARKGQ